MAKELQPRRFELDDRATNEVRQEQLGVIQAISADQVLRGQSIRNLFSENERYDQYEDEVIRQIEDRGQNVNQHMDEAQVLATQLSLDPTRLKNAGNTLFLDEVVNFVSEGQVATTPPSNARMSVRVDYQNAFWRNRFHGLSENDLTRMLQNRTQAELAAIGITLVVAGTHPFHAFTQEQALQVGRRARIPFLRGKLAGAGVSEFNIRLAQKMLMENPDLVRLLGPKDQAAEAPVRAKQMLAELVHNRLGKFTGESHTENAQVAQEQLTHIEYDLQNFEVAGFVARSTFFQTTLRLRNRAAFTGLTTDQIDQRIQRAIQEREKLTKVNSYYRRLTDIIGAVYTQIASIPELTLNGTGPFADLFNRGGTPWVIIPANLSNTTNPVDIQRDLIEKYSIKKPEDYEKELPKHVAGHGTEETQGVKAVLDIFKNHYEQRYQASPDEAVHRAYQTLMTNELSAKEAKQIEDEVFHLTGGKLTNTQIVTNGLYATVKGLFTGSQESYICALAESAKVQIRSGHGTGGMGEATWRPGGFDFGLSRFLGTKALGFLWPRMRARPAWGEIAHDRHKLKIVWDGLRRGLKEGKLQRTLYVQEQMMEVARLLLPTMAAEAAEDLMEHNFSKEEQKEFNMQHWRRRMQEHIGEVIQDGYTGDGFKEGQKGTEGEDEEDLQLRRDAEATVQAASEKQGGWRRAVGRWVGPGGGFWKWMGSKQ